MSYGGFQQATDYIDGTFSTTYPTPLTFVAWINCQAADWLNATQSNCVNMSDDSDSDNLIGMTRLGPSGGDRVGCHSEVAGTSTANVAFTDTTYDDIWIPIIATWDDDTDRDIYIEDSSITGTNSQTRTLGNILDYVTIGVSSSKINRWRGLIAEVAIFNKVLSGAEIDALRTGAQTGPAPNTVASGDCIGYWSLDTDQSTHADESGNSGPTLTVTDGGSIAFDADHPTITTASVTPLEMANYQGMNRLNGGFRS